MKRLGDFIGVSSIVLTVLAAVVLLFQSSANSVEQSLKPQKVKAATVSTLLFAETAGLPSPNKILELVNHERVTNGLEPLQASRELEAVARERAADMSKNVYYAHKNSTGGFYDDIMRRYGLTTEYSCENLDMSFGQEPSIFVQDWLSSTKGHRECMLDSRVTSAGYAVTVLDIPNGENKTSIVVVAIHSSKLHK